MSEFDAQCGKCNTKYKFRQVVENKGLTNQRTYEDVSCPICRSAPVQEGLVTTKIILKDSKAWDLT